MVVPMELAAAARRELLRAARTRGEPAPNGSLALEFAFRRRSASKSFEIVPEAGRNGRTPIIPTEFLSRKPTFGENQHVVVADSKQ